MPDNKEDKIPEEFKKEDDGIYSKEDREKALEGLNVLLAEQRGRLWTYTIRGGREETEEHFRGAEPVFFEVLKLSLEEIFISETEVAGYDVRKFILG